MISNRMQSLLNFLIKNGIRDERVLQAIASVPRERFVDEALSHQSYDNTALPIGAGQTISQPYMVGRMSELLQTQPDLQILEIGTGSGYQTAVLAHLVAHVYSVERIKSLQWQAKRRLKQLDLHNVSTRHGDGWEGWKAKAPFDAIIVTAAPSEVPQALLFQLKDRGRIILPVGENQHTQTLQCIERQGDAFVTQLIEPVRFVPLIQGSLS